MRLLIGAGTPKEAVVRGWCLLVLIRTRDGAYEAFVVVLIALSAVPTLIDFRMGLGHRPAEQALRQWAVKDAVLYQTVIAAIAIRYWRSGRHPRNILLKAAFTQQKTGAAVAAEVRKVEAHNGSARLFQSFRRILEIRGDTAPARADEDVCRELGEGVSFFA